MKKLFIALFLFGTLTSCEEVVDVDLNDAAPRLVVEANINISQDGASIDSWVKLTTTAPFFDDNVPFVADANVEIIDENNFAYTFEYVDEGIYHGTFFPQENTDYTLRIIYKNESYTATTQLQPTATLEYVQQRDDGGFTGEDIELKAFFTDDGNEKNFYYFTGASEKGILRDVYDDEFFNGNTIFGYYLVEDLAPGDNINFALYGVDEQFYNYMYVLLQQTGTGGGPFETQPATVRGNIINETNPDNYPLGYFRISEVSTLNYTVQ
jgi:hypothetical protein